MRARKRSASRTRVESAYTKVSATLETSVLDQIRERSPNVSEFLNEAAKRKLYFERLDEAIEQLEREGFHGDPARVERIAKRLTGELPLAKRK
jgi:hypothetical protein